MASAAHQRHVLQWADKGGQVVSHCEQLMQGHDRGLYRRRERRLAARSYDHLHLAAARVEGGLDVAATT